ncbi:MAG: hypothetical protein AB1898_00295 [Acidobacteriota bacterium]
MTRGVGLIRMPVPLAPVHSAMVEVQKADSTARRRAILLTLGGAALGMMLILTFQSQQGSIENWLLEHREYLVAHPAVVGLAVLLLLSPALAGAGYLWRVGTRIIVTERFPPAAAKVIRDTMVISGRAAVRRGYLLRVLAGVLALNCLLIIAAIWYLIRSMTRTQ